MSSLGEVMAELEARGNEPTRRTYARHGISGDVFGVRIADLKTVAKGIKGRQELALELFGTGNYDAKYLAGMVANGAGMTKRQLQSWARNARWLAISEYTVPWVTCESEHARDLALRWIDSTSEGIACSGWATYAGLLATRSDDELDLPEVEGLLDRVAEGIDSGPNYVRYTMNGFVIAVGSYVGPLLERAKATAGRLGEVEVDMGDTACKVPLASAYIEKVEAMGRVGRKRKTLKC